MFFQKVLSAGGTEAPESGCLMCAFYDCLSMESSITCWCVALVGMQERIRTCVPCTQSFKYIFTVL
jgi:hypothetical protein